jgi:hypothetical protein
MTDLDAMCCWPVLLWAFAAMMLPSFCLYKLTRLLQQLGSTTAAVWAVHSRATLADVRDNYGGAAEDHRCCGGAQQKTESGEKHQYADGGQLAACPAGWLEIRELADPGRVILLELALQVLQQVTVTVIQH